MTRLTLVALLALSSCSGGHPVLTARDAYEGARVACAAYRLAPEEERNPEIEQACAEIENVCGVEP